jgi:pimeloyl-ACP methyl ester carboxylesterase
MPRRRNLALLAAGAGLAVAAGVVASRRRREHEPLATLDGERTTVEASDGATLTVDIAGPSDGPVVVLAHCWGGDPANWAPVAAPLVADGFRVVRWFQRGHGPSTVGSEGFVIERFGDDLAELLVALDLRGAVVAGHSLGGFTTQSFAGRHHDIAEQRVKAFVLVATSSGNLAGSAAARAALPLLFQRAAVVDRALNSSVGTVFVRGALGKAPSPAAVRATLDHFAATPHETRRGVAEAFLAMDLLDGLAHVKAPTTVVVGSRDSLTPPGHSRRIADAIPGATLVVIPGAGHMLPLEAPRELVDLIEAAARR